MKKNILTVLLLVVCSIILPTYIEGVSPSQDNTRLIGTWRMADDDMPWMWMSEDSLILVDCEPDKRYHYTVDDSIMKIYFYDDEAPLVYKYYFNGDTLVSRFIEDGVMYDESKMVKME